jgi:hypothetical protein
VPSARTVVVAGFGADDISVRPGEVDDVVYGQ